MHLQGVLHPAMHLHGRVQHLMTGATVYSHGIVMIWQRYTHRSAESTMQQDLLGKVRKANITKHAHGLEARLVCVWSFLLLLHCSNRSLATLH